jgi:hypothetical protein
LKTPPLRLPFCSIFQKLFQEKKVFSNKPKQIDLISKYKLDKFKSKRPKKAKDLDFLCVISLSLCDEGKLVDSEGGEAGGTIRLTNHL